MFTHKNKFHNKSQHNILFFHANIANMLCMSAERKYMGSKLLLNFLLFIFFSPFRTQFKGEHMKMKREKNKGCLNNKPVVLFKDLFRLLYIKYIFDSSLSCEWKKLFEI